MHDSKGIWWWLAILLIAATTSAAGCSDGVLTGDFDLTPVTMPGDIYYALGITSAEPGELCFRIKDRDRSKSSSNIRFAVLGFDAAAGLTAKSHTDNLPEDYKPACLLPAGEMLYGVRFRDSSGEFSYNIFLSDRDGKEELVLADLRSATGMRGLPALFYDREYGLAMFVPDFEQGFTVWDTSVEPEDMQFISDVVAFGNGFRAGNLTQVFVKADGQVLVYDPELKQAVLDPGLQWLGSLAEVCDISAHNNREYWFAYTAEVAAVRLNDEVLIIDDRGRDFSIRLHSAVEKDWRGWPRSPGQIRDSAMDYLFCKDEGRQVDPGKASTFCSVLPVDDSRLAVFDRIYQRLVFITKAVSE